MSTFVEVQSVEKECPVIINLDEVIEIAPLATGGCALFFADAAAANGKTSYKVKDSYDMFKQFAITPISVADVARVNGRVSKDVKKEKPPVDDMMKDIPKL